MDRYRVRFSPKVIGQLRDIYANSVDRWSYADTDAYVDEILEQCAQLSQMPQRFSFDPHTQHPETLRSFSHKAHKVFFRVNEQSYTVDIIGVLPSRTAYSQRL